MRKTPLLKFVTQQLEELKGREIVTLDVRKRSSITDYMVICSGTSSRHVCSLAEQLVREARLQQIPVLGVEGQEVGEWALVDLGEVIVHVMQDDYRDYYQLEKLWSHNGSGAHQE